MKHGIKLLIIGATFVILAGFSARSDARVNIGIGINIPLFTFAAPPPLVVIPGTYAYFVPDVDVDILFYHGYWYRPYGGRWYMSRAYNGPWAFIAPARVPRVLIGLSPDFRHLYGGYRHIEYRDFNRNWRRWERDRYWDRDERWREGRHVERRGGMHEEHGERERRY